MKKLLTARKIMLKKILLFSILFSVTQNIAMNNTLTKQKTSTYHNKQRQTTFFLGSTINQSYSPYQKHKTKQQEINITFPTKVSFFQFPDLPSDIHRLIIKACINVAESKT